MYLSPCFFDQFLCCLSFLYFYICERSFSLTNLTLKSQVYRTFSFFFFFFFHLNKYLKYLSMLQGCIWLCSVLFPFEMVMLHKEETLDWKNKWWPVWHLYYFKSPSFDSGNNASRRCILRSHCTALPLCLFWPRVLKKNLLKTYQVHCVSEADVDVGVVSRRAKTHVCYLVC